VRDEFGISHDPALNAHNNSRVSDPLNRFLFFTGPYLLDDQVGKSTVGESRGRPLRNT
jgi:hypothetical protein